MIPLRAPSSIPTRAEGELPPSSRRLSLIGDLVANPPVHQGVPVYSGAVAVSFAGAL